MSTFDDRCESGEDTHKNVADETLADDALEPLLDQENDGTNPTDSKDDQMDLVVVEEIVDMQEVDVEELKSD